MPSSSRSEFTSGLRDYLPFLPGSFAFGLLVGAVSVQSGLSELQAIVLSGAMFAGNAQVVSMQLFASGAPGVIVVLASMIVNLRHTIYGLSLAPHLKGVPVWVKVAMGMLFVDNVYAQSLRRFTQLEAQGESEAGTRSRGLAYFFGNGVTAWTIWAVAGALGALVGARLPSTWSLDLVPSLGLIALIVPTLRDRPAIGAALTAAALSTLFNPLPLRVGVLLAGTAAMMIGLLLERHAGEKPK